MVMLESASKTSVRDSFKLTTLDSSGRLPAEPVTFTFFIIIVNVASAADSAVRFPVLISEHSDDVSPNVNRFPISAAGQVRHTFDLRWLSGWCQ